MDDEREGEQYAVELVGEWSGSRTRLSDIVFRDREEGECWVVAQRAFASPLTRYELVET